RKPIERNGVRHFPTQDTDAVATILVDDDSLLSVIHAERKRRGAFVDPLQAELAGSIVSPILYALCADSHVSQFLDAHRLSPRGECILSLAERHPDAFERCS